MLIIRFEALILWADILKIRILMRINIIKVINMGKEINPPIKKALVRLLGSLSIIYHKII